MIHCKQELTGTILTTSVIAKALVRVFYAVATSIADVQCTLTNTCIPVYQHYYVSGCMGRPVHITLA